MPPRFIKSTYADLTAIDDDMHSSCFGTNVSLGAEKTTTTPANSNQPSSSLPTTLNKNNNNNTNSSSGVNNGASVTPNATSTSVSVVEDDIEELSNAIPPAMNVIKADQAEQVRDLTPTFTHTQTHPFVPSSSLHSAMNNAIQFRRLSSRVEHVRRHMSFSISARVCRRM